MRHLGLTTVAMAAALWSSPSSADDAAPATPAATPWCAPELETLPGGVCFSAAPESAERRTLVIFLHGVIEPTSDWQHNQERGIARAGQRLGFASIMPRGRVGIGSAKMRDWITWPTSATAQEKVEDELVAEWTEAQAFLEKRDGEPFDEVFVVGFSNGAYYASSLALRGRLDVDGYAVFAGGSAPDFLAKRGKSTEQRAPVFAGIAAKDSTAKDTRRLAKVLADLGWPHKSESRNVGHLIADAHLDHALTYLRKTVDAGD
jgi:predicted esterase